MSQIKDFKYPFGANETLKVRRTGFVVCCVDATDDFQIRIISDSGQSEYISLRAGLSFTFKQEFTGIEIINGATPQTIVLYIGDDDVRDSRFVGSINAEITSAGSIASAPDVTLAAGVAGLVVNASGGRKTLIIGNDTGADIRVGDASVGAAQGLRVGSGLALTLTSFDGALYAYSAAGGNVSVVWTI